MRRLKPKRLGITVLVIAGQWFGTSAFISYGFSWPRAAFMTAFGLCFVAGLLDLAWAVLWLLFDWIFPKDDDDTQTPCKPTPLQWHDRRRPNANPVPSYPRPPYPAYPHNERDGGSDGK